MLSSINSTRPYSVNNYTKGQNSAKSQPAFGSAVSEFWWKAYPNLILNATTQMATTLPTNAVKPEWTLPVAAATNGVLSLVEAIATKILQRISRDPEAHRLTIREYPLNPFAWIADGVREIRNRPKKEVVKA